MTCPLGDHGQSLCNLVDHPDRPNQSFCSVCQRRFQRYGAFNELLGLMAAIAAIVFLVANGRSRSEIKPVGVGANDLPDSSNIAEVVPARALSPYERMRLDDDSLPERVADWPMEKQLELLNGVGDRTSLTG